MAISNALVDLLNGELVAESKGLGRGSTFTVKFPTTDGVAKVSAAPAAPLKARGKVKLLLVEDHADTARALVRLLASRGYKIDTVSSVKTGLEAIERDNYDLLLCDLGYRMAVASI
jgi:hypothetical protein